MNHSSLVSCRDAGIRGVVTPVQPEEFVEVLEWDIGETEVAAKADHQRMELWIAPVIRCQREALVKLVPLISMKFPQAGEVVLHPTVPHRVDLLSVPACVLGGERKAADCSLSWELSSADCVDDLERAFLQRLVHV